jgi:hypothetical protein
VPINAATIATGPSTTTSARITESIPAYDVTTDKAGRVCTVRAIQVNDGAIFSMRKSN